MGMLADHISNLDDISVTERSHFSSVNCSLAALHKISKIGG